MKVLSRIADLRAAKDLSDLVDWCSSFKTPQDAHDTYDLKFIDGVSLRLVPNHLKNAPKPVGDSLLGATWRVKIISIDHEI